MSNALASPRALPKGSVRGARLVSAEGVDDLDGADDVVVELVEPLGGDPLLEDRFSSDLLDIVLRQVVAVDVEPGHVPDPRRLDVPVACDADGVVLVEHGVEDRLVG